MKILTKRSNGLATCVAGVRARYRRNAFIDTWAGRPTERKRFALDQVAHTNALHVETRHPTRPGCRHGQALLGAPSHQLNTQFKVRNEPPSQFRRNRLDTSKSAYIHPVFHVIRDGIEAEQFHMQESLIGRWDVDDYVDPETNVDQYRNTAFNACASALGLQERRSMRPVLDEYLNKCYPLMTADEVSEALQVQPTLGLLKFRSN